MLRRSPRGAADFALAAALAVLGGQLGPGECWTETSSPLSANAISWSLSKSASQKQIVALVDVCVSPLPLPLPPPQPHLAREPCMVACPGSFR